MKLRNLFLLASMAWTVACSSGEDPPSKLAELNLRHLDAEYDRLQLTMTALDFDYFFQESYPKTQSTVNHSLQPGAYHIELDLFLGDDLVISSNFCNEEQQNSENQQLHAGANTVIVSVCRKENGELVNPEGQAADALIIPEIADSLQAQGSIVARHGKLSTIGNQLVDQNGQAIQLRGISTHGLQWFGQFANYEAIKWLRDDWQINVIRAAMYTDPNADGYIKNRDLKTKVIEVVEAAIELGIYVIIDWHILYDNNPLTYLNESKEFFKEMAETYRDSPHVIFEIANEPNGGQDWEAVMKPYANEVIGVIRDAGSEAVVIVGSDVWSQKVDDAAKSPLSFNNVAYAFHFYAVGHDGDSMRRVIDEARAAGITVFVSEWGTCHYSGDGEFGPESSRQWIEFMKERKISWVNWSLADKEETCAALKKGASPKGGWSEQDLTDSGSFIRNALRNP